MLNGVRQRLHRDEGMSLVELMVAITILGIVLSAMASVLITSLAAANRDESRVRATHLASQEIEHMRGMPWDDLGFYGDDSPPAGALLLGPTRPAGAIAPTPTETLTVDGITYQVARMVYWTDDPATTSTTEDFKTFEVEVSWQNKGQSFTFESSGSRAPNLDEVPHTPPPTAPPGFAIVTYQADPTIVEINASGNTQQALTIRLETTLEAVTPVLTFDASPTDTRVVSMAPVAGSGGTRWEYEIPSGVGWFSPGQHTFTVEVNGVAGGTATDAVVVDFYQPSSGPLAIQPPTLSGQFCASNAAPKATHYPVTVDFEVHGLGPADEAKVGWTDVNGEVSAVFVSTTADGAVFRGVVPAGTVLTGSTTTLLLHAVRLSDGETGAESYLQPIYRTNDPANCP